ncbi:phosphatidylinositol N-acetylglucosaminyltransferase [Ophiocordyceps camponoti-floridani]|uniref:Phosphatidylinositol N-acetylglucosaminyltransferase n=1 Tax=Ophiocordyceps camponoti-floridani TaxID=2030778 RepID=A0A8H4QCX0_9HYPO|nr:phosphatidylinositol N-acetylglucosaminyltransferase [Ophiocordyceps camponoti-floridani]
MAGPRPGRRPAALSPLQPPPASASAPAAPLLPQVVREGGGHGRVGRNRSRRRKRAWKKLMWVKQSYPDNYTDQATFLENLQRNPRLKPYDFWPLVNDSTVILQHVCSVIIFIVCFVAIFQERVSPVSVVSCGSLATFLGWLLWEGWVAEEDSQDELGGGGGVARSGSIRRRGRAASVRRPLRSEVVVAAASESASESCSSTSTMTAATAATKPAVAATDQVTGLAADAMTTTTAAAAATMTTTTTTTTTTSIPETEADAAETPGTNRVHERLETIKSALLIFSTLLGLSPILKSLTRSTSSDSIWAMSFWLLALNVFFFDYSGGVGAKFPASLSTNAALMASTVLASRLPSTKQVFSLTLFSIEVFGLFPVFRRHVRHRSWRYHVVLTVLLVLGAGLGVGIVLGDGRWPWQSGSVGMIVGIVVAAVAAGGCSWWLIGLQKYKNEIRGPWDPARPIIMSRTRWDSR